MPIYLGIQIVMWLNKDEDISVNDSFDNDNNYLYISCKNLVIVVKVNPKASFSLATTPRIVPLTFDTYLMMLSAMQGGIKYHFLSLWNDSTWYWTPVSQATGKCCIATIQLYIYIYTGTWSTDNDDFNNERIHFFIKI